MSLKKNILHTHARFRYPQFLFGKAVQAVAESHQQRQQLNEIKILDAPCGTGETTYHLAQVKNSSITGIDNSKDCIKQADTDFGDQSNIYFYTQDIFEHLKTFVAHYDVINIINSLFLFKDAEKLIKMAQKSLRPQGKLVVIIPNILGANFIAFQKTDNQSNKIIMSREEAVKFFAKCGFEVEHLQGLAYKEHTQNSNFENKLSILKDYYLLLKDFVRKTKGTNQPNYWLFVLVQA